MAISLSVKKGVEKFDHFKGPTMLRVLDYDNVGDDDDDDCLQFGCGSVDFSVSAHSIQSFGCPPLLRSFSISSDDLTSTDSPVTKPGSASYALLLLYMLSELDDRE